MLRPSQFELEQIKKRLSFYEHRKLQAINGGQEVPSIVLKWISIYSERCQKIEAVLKNGTSTPSSKPKSRTKLH